LSVRLSPSPQSRLSDLTSLSLNSYVYNKIDSISLEEVDRLARQPHTTVISCELDLNLEVLKKRIWEKMGFNRIYTKKRGERPDLGDPLVIKTDATIEAVVRTPSAAQVIEGD